MAIPALSPGDEIEYGLSYFHKEGGQEVWISLKYKTHVHEDEDAEEATWRIRDFTHDQMKVSIEELDRT